MQEGAERSRAMLAELRSDPRLARQLRMTPVQTIRELPFLSLAEKTALVRLGRDVLSGWEDASGCACGGSCGGCAGATAAKGGCSGGCGGGCAGKHTDHARAKAPRREVCAKCKGLREDCVCAKLAETAWAWEAMGASVPMHVAESRARDASASGRNACCEGSPKGESRDGPKLNGPLSPRGGRPFGPFDGSMPAPFGLVLRDIAPSPKLGAAIELWRDASVLFARGFDPRFTYSWDLRDTDAPFEAADLDWSSQAASHQWTVRYRPAHGGAFFLEARGPDEDSNVCGGNIMDLSPWSEAHLFTARPNETLSRLVALSAASNSWASENTLARTPPYYVPSDVVLQSGSSVPLNDSTLRMRPEQFWTVHGSKGQYTANVGSWRSPGDAPHGYGGVKTIRHVPHVGCEREQSIQEILDQLAERVAGEVVSGLCSIPIPEWLRVLVGLTGTPLPESVLADVTLDYVSTFSFWREKDLPERFVGAATELEAGFLLRLRLRFDPRRLIQYLSPLLLLPLPVVDYDLPTCDLALTYEYVFDLESQHAPASNLFRGVLTLRAREAAPPTFFTGPNNTCALLLSQLPDKLLNDLPAAVHQEAAGKHMVTSPTWLWEPDPMASRPGCAGAAEQFALAVSLGSDALGLSPARLPLQPSEQPPGRFMHTEVLKAGSAEGRGLWIVKSIARPEFDGQCNPPEVQQCFFLVPAIGISGAPDAVSVRFFDGIEWSNPGFLAFAASIGAQYLDAAIRTNCENDADCPAGRRCQSGRCAGCLAFDPFAGPCGPRRRPFGVDGSSLAYFDRVFANADAGRPLRGPITCVDAPTAPSSPCACGSDRECPRGARCLPTEGTRKLCRRPPGMPCKTAYAFPWQGECNDDEMCRWEGPNQLSPRCVPLPGCKNAQQPWWQCRDIGATCVEEPRYGKPGCRWR